MALSIRFRMTAVAVLVFAIVASLAAAGVRWGVRDQVRRTAQATIAAAARSTVSIVDRQRVAGPLPSQGSGRVSRIQVVDRQGTVLAATAALRGSPPLTRRWADSDTQIQERLCRNGSACLLLVGQHAATSAYGDVMVYAAGTEPVLLTSAVLEATLSALVAGLVLLIGWGTWVGVGRTLRPVEHIGRALSDITVSDLSRRVPVPSGDDELTRLARVANQTLDRLESAVERQRRFASDASHELRSPITGIRLRVEDALADPAADRAETLDAVLTDAERLHQIVDDLLVLARVGADGQAFERIDLGRLVADELARRVCPVAVKPEISTGVVVGGHRLQLARLLTNLLANAERHAESAIGVTVRAESGEAVLEVADDGTGIAPEDRERIFERFTRLAASRERDSGGTGLGLPIARDIARSHRGTLVADSAPGGGARFVLRLPLAGRDGAEDF